MKLRKLKKIKQEQQGWPEVVHYPSSYGYSTFYCSNGSEYYKHRPAKFVHSKVTITTWHGKAWRGL